MYRMYQKKREEHESILILLESKIYQGSLILVNQNHPIQAPMSSKKLRSVFPEQPQIQMEQESAGMLKKLLQEIQGEQKAKKEPVRKEVQGKIVGVSGYRTREEQVQIFENSLTENGRAFTEKYVAFPDCSEHQTGLAMDLAEHRPEIDFICPEFPYDGICQSFRERAAEFGFVERYQEEKQSVTGIGAEPWHFRYVGIPHGELMQEQGMALEEYIEWLKQFDLEENPLKIKRGETEFQIGYVRAQGKYTRWKMPKRETAFSSAENGNFKRERTIKISGNNVDGFVITMITTEAEGRKHETEKKLWGH
ncbi:MAG: M15 family metallopeptidase [Lachnospiraceae bacterium]|nr:M15 family metallopeptidase [Lachnospiraceae bacterium]